MGEEGKEENSGTPNNYRVGHIVRWDAARS